MLFATQVLYSWCLHLILSHFTLTQMESVALLILFILDIYTTNALLNPFGKTFKQQ